MKATFYSILSAILTCLMGCGQLVQEVDPGNVPTTTGKLVIHSYISPQDSVLAVLVEAPRAVLGQQTDYNRISIPNALVDLSDGITTVRLPYSYSNSLYSIDSKRLPIIAGRAYTLTVNTPGYPSVTAQCTVPAPVTPAEIRIDSVYENVFGQQQRTITGRLVWRDPAGQPNFYRVVGLAYRTIKTSVYNGPNRPQRDTILTQTVGLRFNRPTMLATDAGEDGAQFISSTAAIPSYYNYQSEQLLSLQFIMTLMAVDENYYRYHDTIDRQDTAGENPFAEPVLVISNIQNGLGCFGAFNQSSVTVRVR